MANPVTQRDSVEIRRSLLCALLSSALGALIVYATHGIEIQLFARGAATLAGLLSGAPVFPEANGWLLPILSQPVLVNEACSGTDFYLLTAALFGWHLPGSLKKPYHCILLALIGAFFLAISINALRIICLAQAHYWLIPRLPDNYAGFIHMMVGVAIFLPSLILINLTFEYYDRRHHL
jgi:exosortase/archaeosortase family protein